ncbi:hypothetical protein NN3_36670 [Nocardia neocaledoniensis NBRC 108232]|uniref:non-specific serine/threonine protein kinase n=1 Tax=Nocardia neocaledoniensis TaxID=236511 RepID=A0A317NR91_9NOCA|nr:serine/threonine-protein kinase [Nocardia neocaledoniensis]PWV77625.1 serine/threonine protein kinase [Nocardia neocaledoniensis]GEM32660.1 hypothetical protein NN3_36670 [Nocardia neocaledoniensis NBRC 108232]
MDTWGTSATFAGYGIERVLGRGGMGTVYLARHPRLPRHVALKILNSELLGDNEIRQRFEREADLVARLDHPNIVAVQDRGLEGNNLWIAMQYVAGADAGTHGVMDPARAVRIIGDVAAALDFAHGRGILHRDVKPANILLSSPEPHQPERVLLADFGIARLRDDVNGLTQTGTFTATLAYASPEQLSGGILDHRSDQYSLACTLFTLLTGTAPFTATNPVAVIGAHMSAPAPLLSERRPGLPRGLDLVVQRAMAKNPDQRFRSCTQFAQAAEQALRASLVAPMGGPAPAPAWAPVNAPAAVAPPGHHQVPAMPMRPRPPAPSTGRAPLLIALWCAFFSLALSTRGMDYWSMFVAEQISGGALVTLILGSICLAPLVGRLLDPRTVCVTALGIALIGSPLTLAMGPTLVKSAIATVTVTAGAIAIGQLLTIISNSAPRRPDPQLAATLSAAPILMIAAIALIHRLYGGGWWDLWSGTHPLEFTVPPLTLLALILVLARTPTPAKTDTPTAWLIGTGLAAIALAVPIMHAQTESALIMWVSISLAIIATTAAVGRMSLSRRT